MKSSMRAVGLAGLLCTLAVAAHAAAPAAGKSGPQGDSWGSIAKLPDFSGAWTLTGGGRVEAEEAGRYPDNGRVPLTPKYAEIRARAADAKPQSNLSKCLPAGVPGIMKHLVMFEFLMTPGRVTMLYEDGEIRRIYTDGRPHVSLAEQRMSYLGDSIGHWEGGTLVVDTIGFPNGSLWKDFGVLATLQTHLVERMSINAQKQLQVDSVISDPEIFSKPYASTALYQRSPWRMPEPACAQNLRDTGTAVDLTPPPEE